MHKIVRNVMHSNQNNNEFINVRVENKQDGSF
jgi:hypothetical protein